MPFRIVLVEPLIPQNTGSIARLTAATGSELHLIEPLGFELSDRYLKRAGLDYWSEVILSVHPSWQTFLDTTGLSDDQLYFLSTRGTRTYHQPVYRGDEAFVLGNEASGLAEEFHDRYSARMLRIPIDNPRVRSLNVSNAAGIILYEARRQIGL